MPVDIPLKNSVQEREFLCNGYRVAHLEDLESSGNLFCDPGNTELLKSILKNDEDDKLYMWWLFLPQFKNKKKEI